MSGLEQHDVAISSSYDASLAEGADEDLGKGRDDMSVELISRLRIAMPAVLEMGSLYRIPGGAM